MGRHERSWWRHAPSWITGAALIVSALACVAPEQVAPGEPIPWDVRGNYLLSYEDALTVRLNIGGVERVQTARGDEVVDLGMYQGQPLTLDLKAHCARPEVVCPSEALWQRVAVDQQNVRSKQDVHGLTVIDNTTRELPAGQRAASRGGLVSRVERGRFIVGLGGESASQGDCGALAISVAEGRFLREGERWVEQVVYRDDSGRACEPAQDMGGADMDALDMGSTCTPRTIRALETPEGAQAVGIEGGKVAVGWLGVCAFGPVVAGATLSIETRFTGIRTGPLDPPPYAEPPPADLGFPPDLGDAADMGMADMP